MTTGIRQAGLEYNPMNRNMNEPNPQSRSEAKKGSEGTPGLTDTVRITSNVSKQSAMEFAAMDEEEASILGQLVANDLNKSSLGFSLQAGTQALRAFI